MDLFDVAKSCARRWWLFLPLIAGSMWFAYNSYSSVAPVYYGSTTLGLASPSVQAEETPGVVKKNALVESGGNSLMVNLLSLGLKDGAARQKVIAQGGDGGYTAEVFTVPGGQLPLVVISATTPTAELASKTVDLAAAQAADVMRGFQGNAGVPDETLVMPYVVVPSGQPVEGMPSRMKSAVTIMAGGIALTVVTTVIVDLLLTRRKANKPEGNRRRSTATPADPGHSEPGQSTAASLDEARREPVPTSRA